MNVRNVTQAAVSIGTMIGTFVLIGAGKLDADQGLSLMFALLGGLGLGYANGNAAKKKENA